MAGTIYAATLKVWSSTTTQFGRVVPVGATKLIWWMELIHAGQLTKI